MSDHDEGMDELYGEGKPALKSVDEEEQENPSHLLDKKAFPDGCKVGDRYEIEVTAEHGDQAEIKVVTGEKKNKPEMGADEELESMNKEY